MEDLFGCMPPRRNRHYEKYETEIQIVGMVLIKNGFAHSRSSSSHIYSSDLQRVQEIFSNNLEIFFSKRVNGSETCSLKLDTVSVSKEDEDRKNDINIKTKAEILTMIRDIAARCDDLDVDSVVASCSKNQCKQFLIDTLLELVEHEKNIALGVTIE